MNRHEMRVGIVFALYQHLLLHKSLDDAFAENFENGKDEFVSGILEYIRSNKEGYISFIQEHLRKWSFDRLNYVDQAILLEAISEYRAGLNDKKVVIDEAIRIAKTYSDEDSYKYINGVLDNL